MSSELREETERPSQSTMSGQMPNHFSSVWPPTAQNTAGLKILWKILSGTGRT